VVQPSAAPPLWGRGREGLLALQFFIHQLFSSEKGCFFRIAKIETLRPSPPYGIQHPDYGAVLSLAPAPSCLDSPLGLGKGQSPTKTGPTKSPPPRSQKLCGRRRCKKICENYAENTPPMELGEGRFPGGNTLVRDTSSGGGGCP